MTDVAARCIREQPRFRGIFKNKGKFERRVMLASPTMHSDEKNSLTKHLTMGLQARIPLGWKKKRRNTSA